MNLSSYFLAPSPEFVELFSLAVFFASARVALPFAFASAFASPFDLSQVSPLLLSQHAFPSLEAEALSPEQQAFPSFDAEALLLSVQDFSQDFLSAFLSACSVLAFLSLLSSAVV